MPPSYCTGLLLSNHTAQKQDYKRLQGSKSQKDTILVVDLLMFAAFVFDLRKAGYQVELAKDGQDVSKNPKWIANCCHL